jgi:hypothetical protein
MVFSLKICCFKDGWNRILNDWKEASVCEDFVCSSAPVFLDPDKYMTVFGSDVAHYLGEFVRCSKRFDELHTLETVINCLKRFCTFRSALFSRQVHAETWSMREMSSVDRMFQFCFCGCGEMELLARMLLRDTALLLEETCRALNDAMPEIEDVRPLHERMRDVVALVLDYRQQQQDVWLRAMKLCEALTFVGCVKGDGIALLSSSMNDWLSSLVCASVLGLVLRPVASSGALKLKACLVDHKHMNRARSYGVPVLVVDLIVGKNLPVGEEREAKGGWEEPIEVLGNVVVSQKDLMKCAARVVRRLCVSPKDVLLHAGHESLALELFVVCLSGCRASSDPTIATVAIVRTNASCVVHPLVRAIAFVNMQEDVNVWFPNAKKLMSLYH